MEKREIVWARRRVSDYGKTIEFYVDLVTKYKTCVYCGRKLRWWTNDNLNSARTIEHLNHLGNSGNYIVLSCYKCNVSRSHFPLKKWFKTDYCLKRNINSKTVHPFVRKYLRVYERV